MGNGISGRGRILTLPFLGTVSAGGELTLASRRLSFPFVTRKVRIGFALNTNRTLKVKIFIAPDDQCPTSGEPNGFNIFSENAVYDYLVGDDEWKECAHECIFDRSGGYVKAYGINSDTFDHTLDVLVTVQEYQEE